MEQDQVKIAEDLHWFALYTKPRNEFKAESMITSLGIESYLPVFNNTKKWSDRNKILKEPVIRGYVFIHADEKKRMIALQQPMIVRCISDNGRPARIPEWQIANLKIMLNQKSKITVMDGIAPGTRVKILEGPLQGIIGKIVYTDKVKMISVSVDLLNRSVITHLPGDCKIQILDK